MSVTHHDAAARARVRTASGRIGTLIFVDPDYGRVKVRLDNGNVAQGWAETTELVERRGSVVLGPAEVGALELLLSRVDLDFRADIVKARSMLEAVVTRAAAWRAS